ncbi:MAG TPA: hypothetical protein PK597_04445, partial [Oscillospiraceae bacterium]|nr:hypothetical protein [Oscillospiraceae bacterium]
IFLAAVVLAATVFLGTAACASSYDAQADALNEMGLFLGGDAGYELDRASTRGEAAVMLVRLLGRETEAKAGTYEDPFTDVPSWAKQYVGYMYAGGLTKGTSPTTYSAATGCSAQMFTTFVLRALGYSEENGDFTFADAEEFGMEIGLTAGYGFSSTFLRDDMVALAYSALFQPVNDDSGMTLLEKLVAQGAVDAEAADKYLDAYRVYEGYLTMAAKAELGTDQNVEISTSADITMTMEEATIRMTQESDTAIVFRPENEDFIMKQQSATGFFGLTTETTTYYADGWVYTESDGEKYKYQETIDLSTAMSQAGFGSEASVPFYLIDGMEKTETAEGTTYTIAYSTAAMNGMLGGVLSEMEDTSESGSMRYDSLTAEVSFDTDGNIRSTAMAADVHLESSADEQTLVMDMSIQTVTSVVARGDAVTITLPSDLDEYEDLTSEPATGVETV